MGEACFAHIGGEAHSAPDPKRATQASPLQVPANHRIETEIHTMRLLPEDLICKLPEFRAPNVGEREDEGFW